ncbi:hypothetical protein [Paenibacillus dendritiformis]|uniref:hypothetical protein n=1 Tax=Paenibacillus dendritiformis TaxID=130049 RepID=UPI0002FC3C17
MANHVLDTRIISSLVKVFADEPLQAPDFRTATVLQGEALHFQLAYRGEELLKEAAISVRGGVAEAITVHKVELVPSELPIYAHHDGNLLRSAPGLYPICWHPQTPGRASSSVPDNGGRSGLQPKSMNGGARASIRSRSV